MTRCGGGCRGIVVRGLSPPVKPKRGRACLAEAGIVARGAE